MQRYELYYDYGTGFGGIREKGDGNYVLAEEAQAEIDTLHAECDRLTALLEKPKVLKASEVNETGWYFVNRQIQYIWRFPNHEHWDNQSYELSHRRWVNKLHESKYVQFTIPDV